MSQTDVLFITLDSCRYDTFRSCLNDSSLPNIGSISPLHKAQAPSYYTYGSHSSFWMGFTPGVASSTDPFLNPKAGKLFRMSFSGHASSDTDDCYRLQGSNIVEGFRNLGYNTIGSGAVDWFNTSTDTGRNLTSPFDHFFFSGNTWSLQTQLTWINNQLLNTPIDQPRFVFLNVGETHVPYWHEGAQWDRWPSPCFPFGGDKCDAAESSRRQRLCLQWVDNQLSDLISRFFDSTILVCADHGDCWGEDGLWEHGISHSCTLTVPLLLRVRGRPISASTVPPSESREIFRRFNPKFLRK